MRVALVIERCPKCPWYSEMQGCMHNEGPVGIVENDYIINPDCPLPDYVNVEKLLDEIAELHCERIINEETIKKLQKERDEECTWEGNYDGLFRAKCNQKSWMFSPLIRAEYIFCPYCGKKIALAKIKGEI